MLSQIGGVFEIPFPPIFAGVLKWVGILQLDVFTAMPIDCMVKSSFHSLLLLRTLIPLGIMGTLLLAAWCLFRTSTVSSRQVIKGLIMAS